MILRLLLRIILLSWPLMVALAQAQSSRNCTSRCGEVVIQYPFGIEPGCYVDDWFAVDCNSSKPFLRSINLELLEIFISTNTMRVNHPIYNSCLKESTSQFVNLDTTPFAFSSSSLNRFTSLSCSKLASISTNNSLKSGCFSMCDAIENATNSEVSSLCQSGINCCQTTIDSLKNFNISVEAPQTSLSNGGKQQDCNYAFLVDQFWFEKTLIKHQDLQRMTHAPVRINWVIYSSSFNRSAALNNSTTSNCTWMNFIVQCKCSKYYEGNPYLLDGCQDIDECKLGLCPSPLICKNHIGGFKCDQESKVFAIVFGTSGGLVGLILLIVGIWWLFNIIKRKKEIKLKEKYFKQNGGLLLQQQLTSSDGSVDRNKLFNSKDLEKATDHFNVNRILGEGGQGTVYKGMLTDGRIVAVKKSKIVDEVGKVDEFINEVFILSQINQRNIVKLLGCCLETEVPLLVYEFIPNGTLFHYLHDQTEELSLTWDMRLRIAGEVAEALCYLHSSASIPIYHRDIKSTNILLDEKYRAKVADFGTSRSIAIDQTHVTTKVLGTFGYLDPEYFRTSQFTDKSDVYSYGVVLVELLTGQKAISSARSEEFKGLVAYFFHCMEENHLYDIVDAQVLESGKKEEIMSMANLAKRCLNMNAKRRPTMKEVTMYLGRIRSSTGNISLNFQEDEYERDQVFEAWDVDSTSTSTTFDNVSLSIDIQPLLTKRSFTKKI